VAACLVLAGSVAAGLAASWPARDAKSAWTGPGAGAGALAAGTVPPYYVTLDMSYPQNTATAIVRSSATGAALATVHVPALPNQANLEAQITAAGDDRTFVITEAGPAKTTRVSVPPSPRYPYGAVFQRDSVQRLARFYLLRVAASGRSASLTALPVSIPANLMAGDMALSPDGSMLAIAAQSCQSALHCQYTGIRIITLATDAARNWTTQEPGAVWNLSWAGNGHLTFRWQSRDSHGYRLLSVTGAGGNLAARTIAGPPRALDYFLPPELFTPDGNAVITSTVRNIPGAHGRDTVVAKIIEISPGTGQVLRVLYTATARNVTAGPNGDTGTLDTSCKVLALGPTGVHALVECFGFGRLDGTRFTPLPGVPAPIVLGTTVSGTDFSGTGDW
jgi:hypothetical protein